MNMLEIEIKARVENVPEIEQRIAERGTFIRSYHKQDVYFRVANGPHVRLRSESDGSGMVTRKYKQIDGGIETSREDEFSVDNPQLAERLLRDLGAEEWIRKEKVGNAYSIDGLTVELSEVAGLGSFIEIEWVGSDEITDAAVTARKRVCTLAAELGIDPGYFESRPYTQLLQEAGL